VSGVETVLLFDRGNRALKAALERSGTIERRWREEPGEGAGPITAILDSCAPAGIAYSSVVPGWGEVLAHEARARGVGRLVEAGSGVRLPIALLVDNPERLGADRICAACGVAARGGVEAVIVDAGTAVTVDCLSAEGFLGGAIFPGVDLMLRALSEGTGALPLVRATAPPPDGSVSGPPPPLPGRSTEGAMRGGVFWGWVGGVRELVARARDSIGADAPVVITGGGAALIAPYIGGSVRIDRDLVFAGLGHIYRLNR
jgi:pantothenate kinase type III